jgi:ABC-type sugar transport system permease subunit
MYIAVSFQSSDLFVVAFLFSYLPCYRTVQYSFADLRHTQRRAHTYTYPPPPHGRAKQTAWRSQKPAFFHFRKENKVKYKGTIRKHLSVGSHFEVLDPCHFHNKMAHISKLLKKVIFKKFYNFLHIKVSFVLFINILSHFVE